jgi:LmbE family N-acetylglucosaminyl deacetylase
MRSLEPSGRSLRILCLGAHPDDIEIGAGGTLLQLVAGGRAAAVTWVVLSGTPERVAEGLQAARLVLAGVTEQRIVFHDLPDGRFPASWARAKELVEALKADRPDLVIGPALHDAHQDHRLVAELTWTTFRDHLVLGYEIPKYDGDLATPNVYVPLSEAVLARKVEIIESSFRSQADRTWFDPETFRGLARIRGIEAGGVVRYAEAFHARKAILDLAGGEPGR